MKEVMNLCHVVTSLQIFSLLLCFALL